MCGVATFNPPQRPRLLLGPHSKPGVVVQNLSQGSGSKQAAHPKEAREWLWAELVTQKDAPEKGSPGEGEA